MNTSTIQALKGISIFAINEIWAERYRELAFVLRQQHSQNGFPRKISNTIDRTLSRHVKPCSPHESLSGPTTNFMRNENDLGQEISRLYCIKAKLGVKVF